LTVRRLIHCHYETRRRQTLHRPWQCDIDRIESRGRTEQRAVLPTKVSPEAAGTKRPRNMPVCGRSRCHAPIPRRSCEADERPHSGHCTKTNYASGSALLFQSIEDWSPRERCVNANLWQIESRVHDVIGSFLKNRTIIRIKPKDKTGLDENAVVMESVHHLRVGFAQVPDLADDSKASRELIQNP